MPTVIRIGIATAKKITASCGMADWKVAGVFGLREGARSWIRFGFRYGEERGT